MKGRGKREKGIRQALAEQKRELVQVCRALSQKKLLAATDGNLSVRWGENLLITPSGVNKGFVREEEMIMVDLSGRVLAGSGRPTTELLLHLEVYQVRPEVQAVVHAHPPIATAFTIAGVPLLEGILPEVVLTLGAIPTAPYATTGTPEMATAVRDLLPFYDAILLDHHGALTLGRDLWDAYNKMEKVEHAALTVLLARQLGAARPLPPEEVAKLTDLGISKGYRPSGAG
ncbi:class II aldolase/adducin family protein [Desulfobacca acetoxidans]|uniref:L-fuculose-phosphate aldolase n=1 Tax=Desulfobacca acetoxidans (strain ATCC 700848 / DSM 11109 / ASRB2) TaxID=880072 RepID=F2NF49_DESAR|nr:class II aldolase/adducin family protein [Desulfobacca acetoxidans]AEB08389.1 L-fuculose-phosphate aldolase [Desulfobacca acetoxidans DSM 11109]